MKRSTALKRKTALARGQSQLKRSGPPARKARLSQRARRPKRAREARRDDEFRAWVREQPCAVTWYMSDMVPRELRARWGRGHRCLGRVEAAHLGGWRDGRGFALKAHDRTCVPLCHGAHQVSQHLQRGPFEMGKAERAALYDDLVSATVSRWLAAKGQL